MTLTTESGWLYLYSKKLKGVNKKLQKLSKRAQKQADKYAKASDKDKAKYKKKHQSIKEEIKKAMTVHRRLMTKIKHHLLGFGDSLKKEHRL